MQEDNRQNKQENTQPNNNSEQPSHEETRANGDNGGNSIPQEESCKPFGRDRNENENIIAAEANHIARQANRIAERANKISWFSFIGSAIIIFFTGYLLYKTIQSTDATVKAANAAVTADSVSIESLKLSKKQFDSSIASNRDAAKQVDTTLKLQSKSVAAQINSTNAQINAFNREEERFKIQTQPRLTITEIKVDTLEVGRKINVLYKLGVVGNTPVIVTAEARKIGIGNNDNEVRKFDFSKLKLENVNIDITYPAIIYNSFEPDVILDSTRFNALNKAKTFIYLVGQSNYVNLFTKDTSVYKFAYKIEIINRRYSYISIEGVINRNFPQ